jgi:hypothetical protein
MIKKYVSAFFLCIFILEANAQITAITENGKAVILFGNGTWRYLNDSVMISNKQMTEFQIPKSATKFVKGKNAMFTLWYDENKWKVIGDRINANAELTLEYHNGDIMAFVIIDRIQLSLEKIRSIALNNLKQEAVECKISEEHQIRVNNCEGLLLKIDALIDDTPFTYLNGYFSTHQGTFLIMTYTGYNLFDRYRRDMTALISGFVLLDQ